MDNTKNNDPRFNKTRPQVDGTYHVLPKNTKECPFGEPTEDAFSTAYSIHLQVKSK